MEEYDISKLLNLHSKSIKDSNFKNVSFDYKIWLNNFIKTNKPDYIAVLKINEASPVLFCRNFNLKFPNNSLEQVSEIFNLLEKDTAKKIFMADKLCFDLIKKNHIIAELGLFQLRFSAELIKGQKITLLRSVSKVPARFSNGKLLLSASFTDITGLDNIPNKLSLDIKLNVSEGEFKSKIKNLKEKIQLLFEQNNVITKREKEVLDLVSKGNTSEQISSILNISKATVSTHRQNLIKKFNVKNTMALINVV